MTPSKNPLAEEGMRVEKIKAFKSLLRQLHFKMEEDDYYALHNAFDAAVNAYGQPTELERELTAALRHVLDNYRIVQNDTYGVLPSIRHAIAVLAKATERGL